MKTYIRTSDGDIISLVSASRPPKGHEELKIPVPAEVVENLGLYQFSGDAFVKKPDASEILERRAAQAAREKRAKLLQSTDWTQFADSPADSAAWAIYRQALRDITKQSDFPNAVVWPTPPS